MKIEEYLEAEFSRYHPDAGLIEVDADDEEIEVFVRFRMVHYINYHMSIGSDDEYFAFTNNVSDRIVTVPLMPEQPKLPTKSLREELRDHQMATGADDDCIVEILCEFLQKLDDDGQLEAPWHQWLIEYVVECLERGPGDVS